MLAIEDRGRWLWYAEPGVVSATIWLREPVLAAGAGDGESSVLDASGVVWKVERTGLQLRRRLKLPGAVVRAAISPGGDLCAVAVADPPKHEVAVHVLRGDGWERVSEPDFLEDVTDLRCAADGASFGYACRTGQPWAEYGSYGDRMAGAVVLDAGGHPLRETWDTRDHDDNRDRRLLAWGPGGDPLVFTCEADPGVKYDTGSTTVHFGGAPDPAYPTLTCPAGAPRRKGALVIELVVEESVRAVVSKDGRRVGAVDRQGNAWVLDLAERRRRKLVEGALAMELATPGAAGVVTTEGLWLRAPLPSGGWESVEAGEEFI